MKLRKIDSIEALHREKFRLQKEKEIAKELLHLRLQSTIDSGKSTVLNSWKVLLPIAIGAGVKYSLNSESATQASTTTSDNPILASFQEGFNAFQLPGKEKWIALVPILLRLWENYQSQQDIPTTNPNPNNFENETMGSTYETVSDPIKEGVF